ncbi:seven transmembrane MLO family protein [Striga asiatica]|uniref:Seven transmembrane MLO family protein n=1 Tax=Striga asiatica TaxID=4170 RepID=A0A5A7QI64_STRAF|nr:seven transmembrane MLO family protein [Striga asiatica]
MSSSRGGRGSNFGQKRRNIDTGPSSSRPPFPEFANQSIHVDIPGVADEIDEAMIERIFGSIQPEQQEQQQPYHDHFDDIFGESPPEVQQPTQQQQPDPEI